ncbi:CLUMA_CG016740, isoform A [Clunio marinus]|uniref:CLUMA_CG016740, isoform A n=1 Tax=Clunio marinus TaxID=568069 RepID=A0A1J1IU34_9DIPT|nr:CLUMA_CG016740, isoform A [Clunio marinus]
MSLTNLSFQLWIEVLKRVAEISDTREKADPLKKANVFLTILIIALSNNRQNNNNFHFPIN